MKKICLKIFFILLIFLSFFAFIIYTNMGLKFIIFIGAKTIPAEIRIRKITGTLSHFEMENFFYKKDALEVNIKYFSLDWRPSLLREKKLYIKNISAQNIRINLISQKHNHSFSIKNYLFLAKYIVAKYISINNLNVITNNKLFILNRVLITPLTDGSKSWVIQSPYGYINFVLKINGMLEDNKKHFQLALSQVDGQLKQLPIHGAAQITFKNNILKFKKTEFKVLNTYINIAGTASKILNINWEIKIPQLNLFHSQLGGSIFVTGKLNGSSITPIIHAKMIGKNLKFFQFNLAKASAQIDSASKSKNINFNLSAAKIKLKDFFIPHLRVNSQLYIEKYNIGGHSLILLDKGNKLDVNFNIPPFNKIADFSQPIFSTIHFNFMQLNKLFSLNKSNYLDTIKGEVRGNAEISGNFYNPYFTLQAQLNNGYADIPKFHTHLHSIFLKATYQSTHPLNLNGYFELGGGKATVKGQVDLENQNFPFMLNVYGKDMELKNKKEYKIHFSPILNIEHKDHQFNIQGKINISNATISPQDYSQVTTLPSEVVIVSEKNTEAIAPNLILKIKIDLSKVKLVYQKLKIMLKGSLSILQTPHQPLTGIGTLSIFDGTYQLYGRSLSIKEGKLIYTGNVLTNPGLDIKAIQKFYAVSFYDNQSQFNNDTHRSSIYSGTQALIVGAWIKGNLSEPKIIFFSDPRGLTQGDILSYLTFGVPQSQISKESSLTLLNGLLASSTSHTSALNLGKIAKKLEKTFKLNELSVGSTEIYDPDKNSITPTTTVNVSRKIGEKLSVHYKAGVFTPISILSLRYKINKNLVLQTETNHLETGADILYEVEID